MRCGWVEKRPAKKMRQRRDRRRTSITQWWLSIAKLTGSQDFSNKHHYLMTSSGSQNSIPLILTQFFFSKGHPIFFPSAISFRFKNIHEIMLFLDVHELNINVIQCSAGQSVGQGTRLELDEGVWLTNVPFDKISQRTERLVRIKLQFRIPLAVNTQLIRLGTSWWKAGET